MPLSTSSLRSLMMVALLAVAGPLGAQIQRPGKVNEFYAQSCASCHGAKLEGASAPSMLGDAWVRGGDDESIARIIRDGVPDKGMPAWGAAMSEKEIRAMVIFIREQRARFKSEQAPIAPPAEAITVKTAEHDFQVKTWVEGLTDPWSMTFLPGDRALVTEKRGWLYLIEAGKLSADPIAGLPEIDNNSQAGLFDLVPHPDYAKNGWLYLAFSDLQVNAEGKRTSLTRIIRGKLRDGALVDQQTIFQAPLSVYPNAGGVHFGGRLAFDRQGYLFFTIGERGTMTNAQDLTVPMGKVHRVFDDGRIPDDNPFASEANAARTIWSYGHRNPQGLAFHPGTGDLYDAEHGPRGGDEVNRVLRARNYGWPLITYGMNYDGSSITELTAKEGLEQPVKYWVPSIAPAGISFYRGDLFPKWRDNLFVASLAAQELHRLVITDQKVVTDEIIFKGLGRIRHVLPGPDGALYVLLPTRIARLTPAE